MPREHFPELIRACPEITAALVHVMVDRARVFTSSDLHDEKMKSLGKLAAGLAHELNNPASAVVRSAKSLVEGLVEAEEASRALGAASSYARTARRPWTPCATPAWPRVRRDPVRRSKKPIAWTPSPNGWKPAAPTRPWRDRWRRQRSRCPPSTALPGSFSGDVLEAALRWVAHGCAARSLAREIETAGPRIYELVAAVKGFTQVDRETAAQPMDVGQGLSDTLTMLRAKVKAKSAAVAVVGCARGFPPCMAYGGELNQVWLNLIDNALDAVATGGRVEVSAEREGAKLVVRIADDGHGIPPTVLPRIFDPFFTTKPIGQGTGLGLDIVRRLVNRHDGEIEVESHPGRTIFTVSLPVRSV